MSSAELHDEVEFDLARARSVIMAMVAELPCDTFFSSWTTSLPCESRQITKFYYLVIRFTAKVTDDK